jgi:phosphatidylinositol-3-phosphatase
MKTYQRPLALVFSLIFVILLQIIQPGKALSQVVLPLPDHIVVAFLENHAYGQIIGSSAAPHINALAADPFSALFTQSFGAEHPSQPNYLDFYSGANQGVTNDDPPTTCPFTTPNLGRQLLDAGLTFITYSEDLPEVGFNGAQSGEYMRKHNPAANWMGTGTNQVPVTINQPLTAFPTANFNSLPTVCFVVPNQLNNMHNGIDPDRITRADTWIYDNLGAYIEWAKTHNSLLILTFDEDNDTESNRIATIFTGEMVKAGEYSETINHYSVLRTIEDTYGLPYAGSAATTAPITDCWIFADGIKASIGDENVFSVYPNPAGGEFSIKIESSTFGHLVNIEICSMYGDNILEENIAVASTGEIHLKDIAAGVYFVSVSNGKRIYIKKLIVM